MRFKLNLRETWNRQYRIICEKDIATANGNNLHCIIPLESLKWKILKKNSSMYIHIQKLNRASSDRVMNNFQKDRTGNALEKQKWITPAIYYRTKYSVYWLFASFDFKYANVFNANFLLWLCSLYSQANNTEYQKSLKLRNKLITQSSLINKQPPKVHK